MQKTEQVLPPHLGNGCFVIGQPQQKDPHPVDLHRDRSPSPLHFAHGRCLFGSSLSDQCLENSFKKSAKF